MKKHFVIFFSPGTFVAEQSQKPIGSWDTDKAIEMSHDIEERHSALPYGFCFITREREDNDLDSHEIKRSGIYFLGGEVLTLQDVKDRNEPKDRILISNMECNGYDRIVVNSNSWQWTQPLSDNDVVLSLAVRGKHEV